MGYVGQKRSQERWASRQLENDVINKNNHDKHDMNHQDKTVVIKAYDSHSTHCDKVYVVSENIHNSHNKSHKSYKAGVVGLESGRH